MALRSRLRLDLLRCGEKSVAAMKPPPIHYLESVDYERRTGGWIYNNRLIACLRDAGCALEQLRLPAFFDAPDAVNAANFESLIEGLPAGSLIIADNLYLMRFATQLRRRGLNTVSIFHHPIAEERAVDGGEESELERRALAEASLIVCTSELTATRLVALDGIDSARVVVAVPGVDPYPPSSEHTNGRWQFLSVGAVVPRKRYEFLIHALAGLQDRNWHCGIVGNVSRYPAYVAELNETICSHGLSESIALLGELDEPTLGRLWEAAHVFLFSSGYEGYGMAIAEAPRRGLPIVTTPAGAVADWASDGVVIVRSDDPAEMAIRIAEIRNNRSAYLAVRNRALSFGKALPTWDESLRPAVERIKLLAGIAAA